MDKWLEMLPVRTKEALICSGHSSFSYWIINGSYDLAIAVIWILGSLNAMTPEIEEELLPLLLGCENETDKDQA